MSKLSLRFLLGAAGLTVFIFANADDSASLGGTRSAGMGGAGIALPVDTIQNHRLNPAFLGFGKVSKVGIQIPNVEASTKGINFSDLHKVVGSVNKGGVSQDTTTNLYNDYGQHRVEAAADGSLGVVLSNYSIDVDGGANITSIPNQALAAGGPTAAGARLDAYGYGFYELGFGAGFAVPTANGTLDIGGHLRSVSSYFAHKVATQTGGTVNTVNGAEFNGSTDDSMNKKGVGGDLGFLYSPKELQNVYFGATIQNLIVPKVDFTRTLPNSNVAFANFNPFVTTTTVGAGAEVGKSLLVAADLYDISQRAGDRQLRLGVELTVGRLVAIRAGYNSAFGFTLGADVLGVNIAISGRQPLLVSTAIHF